MMQSKQAYTKLAVEKLNFAQRARSPEIATMYYSATAAYAAMAAIAPTEVKVRIIPPPQMEYINELNQAGHDSALEEED